MAVHGSNRQHIASCGSMLMQQRFSGLPIVQQVAGGTGAPQQPAERARARTAVTPGRSFRQAFWSFEAVSQLQTVHLHCSVRCAFVMPTGPRQSMIRSMNKVLGAAGGQPRHHSRHHADGASAQAGSGIAYGLNANEHQGQDRRWESSCAGPMQPLLQQLPPVLVARAPVPANWLCWRRACSRSQTLSSCRLCHVAAKCIDQLDRFVLQ